MYWDQLFGSGFCRPIYALKGPWMDEMLWIAHQVTVPREP